MTQNGNDDNKWNDLERMVRRDIKYSKDKDWRNFKIAQSIIVIGLLSSSLAALSSALEWGKYLTTIFAIIPTFVYAVGSRLRFEDRSFFYYENTIRLKAILLDIEFRNKPVEDIIARLQKVKTNARFPRLGGVEQTEG
jgi:hypothetical protein